MRRSAFIVAVMAVLFVISGCSGSGNFELRKNHLMMDCQCEPGTNEYSYKLAGILIEEQEAARAFVVDNKSRFLECAGLKESEYEELIKNIDKQISFNKKARPYFLTKFFFGESPVRNVTGYKEARFDLMVQSLDAACAKTAARGAAPDSTAGVAASGSAGNSAVLPSVANAESAQSAAAIADASTSQAPRKLSPAAEKAISEGFVEITNPAVQACTDKRIEVLRKQIGEDAPINFDVYNEAAVACGFNI